MRRNQLKIGVILSYISQIIQILTGLIYTPVMLRLLGQSEYGLYQLVSSVVSYLSLLSLGFGSSYIRYYSRYKAESNQKEIAQLNGMFICILSVLSIICLICGSILVENTNIIFGSSLSENELSIAKILMLLMVFNLALTFPNSLFDCNIMANEQFIFQKSLIILQNILNPFLTLPLLILGYGSIGMVVLTTILTIGKFIINILYCVRKLKIKFIFKQFKLALLKDMWYFTFFIFLNQLIDQINWGVDKLLLGRISGTLSVAVYGVSAQLNSMYMQFSTTISSIFIPRINKIVAESNDNNLLTEIFTRVGRIQFIILSLIISGFVFFGKFFIYHWAGAGYSDSYWVTLLLLIPVTIPLIQNLGIEIQRAKNMHKTRSIVYLIMAILNIVISIFLIRKLDSIGAAIGTAISLLLGNGVFMNYYYHKKVGLNIFYFWKQIIGFIPALIPSALIGVIIMVFVPISNWFVFGCCVVFYTIAYIFLMWFFGMNYYEKQLLLKIVVRNK